ncbi:hypothetical protein [Rhodopseudomonas palustris]|uniref:Uncharacterized protein n=1 Tax=Rhodopseudomonas palustris (strain BisB18) TaxID=316056 RepID=Q20Z83_RHOPB
MAKILHAVLGFGAITVGLGVAQLALGSDLGVATQARDQTLTIAVNRSAKSDRIVTASTAATANTRTLSFRVVGQPDLSVALRIPADQRNEARLNRPSQFAPATRPKRMVACEPVVSVLTEIAKQLQPGRCLT